MPDKIPSPKAVVRRERRAWWALRVSAFVLILLTAWHLLIMHIANDAADLNYEFIATRWDRPLWRVFDLVLLVAALVHGTVGVKTVIGDHVRGRLQVALQAALAVLTVAAMILGAFVLFTFDPAG